MNKDFVIRTASEVVPVTEAAERLDLGINQTYQALHARKIPGFQIGRRWIIPRIAFEKMLRGE